MAVADEPCLLDHVAGNLNQERKQAFGELEQRNLTLQIVEHWASLTHFHLLYLYWDGDGEGQHVNLGYASVAKVGGLSRSGDGPIPEYGGSDVRVRTRNKWSGSSVPTH